MRAESSKKIQQIVGPIISITLLGYFIYHIIQGERGFISWMRLKQKVEVLEERLTSIQEEQSQLEQRVYLLRPDSLDRDMLEEQARKVLNYANADELIIHDTELSEE